MTMLEKSDLRLVLTVTTVVAESRDQDLGAWRVVGCSLLGHVMPFVGFCGFTFSLLLSKAAVIHLG